MAIIKEIEKSNVIALDTSIFIYYIEKHEKYCLLLDEIFERCNTKLNEFKIITSTISLIEVLVKPIKEKQEEIANKYLDILLSSENVFVIMIDVNIAKKSAELRAKYNFLRTPDAIQLATSICTNAEFFICNDKKLKDVKEIKTLVLEELLLCK